MDLKVSLGGFGDKDQAQSLCVHRAFLEAWKCLSMH